MDITSFILGISSVIVVASVTGVVIGLIKNVYDELKVIQDADDKRWSEHRRSLDSRLDKLILRIGILEEKVGITKQKKQLLND